MTSRPVRENPVPVRLLQTVEPEVGKAEVAEQPQVAQGVFLLLQRRQRPMEVRQRLLPASSCCNSVRHTLTSFRCLRQGQSHSFEVIAKVGLLSVTNVQRSELPDEHFVAEKMLSPVSDLARKDTRVRTSVYTYTHTNKYIRTHSFTHTHTHTQIYIYPHSLVHTHTHTYTHTHSLTHSALHL